MTTNYERIKQMSVEEMASKLGWGNHCTLCPASDICPEDTDCFQCETVLKQWLESEAEDG